MAELVADCTAAFRLKPIDYCVITSHKGPVNKTYVRRLSINTNTMPKRRRFAGKDYYPPLASFGRDEDADNAGDIKNTMAMQPKCRCFNAAPPAGLILFLRFDRDCRLARAPRYCLIQKER